MFGRAIITLGTGPHFSYFLNFATFTAFFVFMAALRSRCGHYIFALWFLSFGLFLIPRLISTVGDWMSTILPHMVWS